MTQDIINTTKKALELGEPGANLVMALHKIPNYDQQLREFGRLQAEHGRELSEKDLSLIDSITKNGSRNLPEGLATINRAKILGELVSIASNRESAFTTEDLQHVSNLSNQAGILTDASLRELQKYQETHGDVALTTDSLKAFSELARQCGTSTYSGLNMMRSIADQRSEALSAEEIRSMSSPVGVLVRKSGTHMIRYTTENMAAFAESMPEGSTIGVAELSAIAKVAKRSGSSTHNVLDVLTSIQAERDTAMSSQEIASVGRNIAIALNKSGIYLQKYTIKSMHQYQDSKRDSASLTEDEVAAVAVVSKKAKGSTSNVLDVLASINSRSQNDLSPKALELLGKDVTQIVQRAGTYMARYATDALKRYQDEKIDASALNREEVSAFAQLASRHGSSAHKAFDLVRAAQQEAGRPLSAREILIAGNQRR